MSATGGKQRRLIATTFVAGFGALLLGAVTSRDAETVAAGDTQKEAKAVSAHDLASEALLQVTQPSSLTQQLDAGGDMASKALRQSSLPSARRAEPQQQVEPQQPAQQPVETTAGTSSQQLRLPPPPQMTGPARVIPVAGQELASMALQRSTTPSSRRQQGTSAHQVAENSIQRLQLQTVSTGPQQTPQMSSSSISDSRSQRNATLSALRNNGLIQDGDAQDQGNAGDAGAPVPQGGVESVQPPGATDEERTFGEEPQEDTTNTLLFLRTDTILLDPGEWQFDITLQYMQNTVDFANVGLVNGVPVIGEAVRRQRILLLPMELRMGVTPYTQAFVNVPFGWANNELAFAGSEEFMNDGGISDVSFGLTTQLVQGNEICPEILGTVAWSAPTGDASLLTTTTSPGTNLGEGFWTMRGDLLFVHNYDPVVVFYGFGYRHRFNNEIDGFNVDPGQQAFYRLGVGFAVNPQVTLSTAFLGNYIGSDVIEGVRVAGGIREPMSLRFAATVTPKCPGHWRTIEPFVNVGITDEALDTIFGITWTR